MARVEASLAYVWSEMGTPSAAVDLLDTCLSYAGITDETRGILHGQLGLLHMLQGDGDRALAAFDIATTYPGEHKPLGLLFLNRGNVHLQRGDSIRATADFGEAERHFKVADEPYEAAKARHNLGYSLLLEGDLPAAIAAMESAYPWFADEGPVMKALVEQDRAEALLAAGLAAEGRALLEEATNALRYLHQRRGEAHLTLARNILLVDPEAALRSARRSRAAFLRGGTPIWQLRAEAVIFAAQVRTGAVRPALVAEGERLAVALEAAGLPWVAAVARMNTARIHARRGNLGAAWEVGEPVRVRRAPLDVRLLAADVRAEIEASAGKRADAFRHLRRGLADLHAWQSSFGSLDLQTNVAGQGRALAMRGLTLAVESRRAATLFEWSERARMLASRIQPVRAPRNDEIAAGLAELRGDVTPEREAELRSRIRELAWQHEGSREVVDPVSLRALQEQLGDTSLVAYVATEHRLVALHVTAAKARWHDLGETAAVKHLLGGLLPDLDVAASDLPGPMATAVRGELVARLDRLRELLVDPLRLDDAPVVLTPSGLLAGVPWSLLLPGRAVTVAQSATSWLGRRTTPLRLNSAGFVAGPRVARAEGEARAAAKEWPGATVLAGDEATADEVTSLASRVDVLHVAAHGRHSSENPLFSGLQLADGTWFGYDIDQLEAVPDVVLLSACEVGRSSVRWGEELIGMTAAWLHAGARCVVASPAAVNDEAAYDVLVALHRGLATGLDPAAALGAAVAPASADRPPAPFLCFG